MKTTITPELAIFAPIELAKVTREPDGTLIVPCVVSSEHPDDQGEVVTYDALKKAAADYMTWANVREMHQPSAVGTTLELELDDELRKATAVLHVVDPVAVAKVEAGVYKGVSIGGRKLAFGKLAKVGGRSVRPVTEILWNELSLADRPSNPEAVLTLAKRSDPQETAVADEPPTPTDAAADDAAATLAEGVQLSKAAEAADAPDPTSAAPVAGGSADAAPADGQPAADPDPAPLAKSAADDVVDAHMVIERITRLIEQEAGEGEAGQVADLRAALEAMQRFTAAETAEVGTPEDLAEAEEEKPVAVVVVNDMYYAAVTGDLAKRALELRKAGGEPAPQPDLDQLVTLALAAGGRCGHEAAPAVPSPAIDGDALAKFAGAAVEEASDALMTKVSAAIGAIARPDDLEAMKGEILGALAPMKEELAKIAAQPASGGPLRYAHELRRFSDGESAVTPALEADVLAKLAQSATDPVVREALGRQAAAAQIRAQQG